MSRNSDKLFVFSSKSLSVITDCVHYKNGSKIGSANHTLIRQLNSLFSYFEKIYICCPLKNTSDGHILSYYDKKNIKFYFTPNVGGRSFQSKVSLILSIPFLLKQIFNATVNSDFVYHPTIEGYSFIQLRDSVYGKTLIKPRSYRDLTAAGSIDNSLYLTLEEQNKDPLLTYYLSDIYAWTIDFFRLAKGDKFKVIYTQAFIDDTIPVAITKVKAAYFVHKGIERYAFEYETDSIKGIIEYLDQDAKNLRRAFLQSPIKFGRISSRYNLRRRIALYGNRIRPHKGTDFAAPVGTPILSTANGTVTEVSYTRANGRYVKVKHNNTYTTQYLHMQKANVKIGQFVEQGDVIGFVGMTGYTSGPHVCYRFWKNGLEVDPFKQKLPEAKPINESLKKKYFSDIVAIKSKLDSIVILNKTSM